LATEFLRHFTPSVLRLSAEARAGLGAAADLVERAAMRRVWEIGPHSYQVVAVHVPLPGDPPGLADLLVRRRYTLEPGVAIVAGSVRAALGRALDAVRRLREPTALASLLAQYNARGVNAGLAPASAMLQCFVLAPPPVFAAAVREADSVRALRAEIEAGEIGFRFLSIEGEADHVRVMVAPPPFDSLDLVRPVAVIHR
jgi:hypothetical protein